MHIIEKSLTLSSAWLKREVTCTLLLPEKTIPTSLLLLNDGQELENLKLKASLEHQLKRSQIEPLLVVAIHAGEERIQEYGVAGKPDFKQRGAKADDYTRFVIEELLPAIEKETGYANFKTKAFAGFSLGGLSALDIAWNHTCLFDKVGVFSGSLWWRNRDLNDGYTDADRIMHSVVRETQEKPNLKFWLQNGTKDESADRNQNGIIDAIDDTVDLIKELETKGYSRPADIHYMEVVGGEHNTATWGRVMPKFLCWAFGG